MRGYRFIKVYVGAMLCWILAACSPTKHVPTGSYLLDHVKIETDDKEVKASDLKSYLRQEPNHRMFGLFRFTLGIYNMSGQDTSKRFNRWAQKTGAAPVIYDPSLIESSRLQIEKAMNNKGYMEARVEVDTLLAKKKRIDVRYRVMANKPHYIASINYNIPHDSIARRIEGRYRNQSLLKVGDKLDRNVLDKERQRITDRLRRNGFYAFNKELISYSADTSDNSKAVNLTMNLLPEEQANASGFAPYEHYYMRNIYFILDENLSNPEDFNSTNTTTYKAYYFVEGKKSYINRKALVENCFIRPGIRFSTRDVDNTYSGFARMHIIKHINIRFEPAGVENGKRQLDCYIFINKGKSQSVSFEVEGTNSEGDLGMAAAVTYQHRNAFRGSEAFSAKVRGAYESLSGDLSGLINDHYTELGGEIGVNYPQFLFPFLRADFRRRMKASTEFNINTNYQQRPEYTRVIWGGAWKYKWSAHRGTHRHTFDLLDINYVYLPDKTDDFLDNIAPDNPLLRYSYEDHFIMRLGYSFYCSNLNPSNPSIRRTNVYTLRASGEIAGNLLDAISSSISSKPREGGYKIFGIRYSQYAKFDFDYSITHRFDDRNSIAFHVGGGVGIPYGNSDIMPFEKRYYSGGANSVRGWSVRTLGPGSYNGNNSVAEFMNQCGDIRLDMNIEYRAKLFWKLELGAFIDAGNVWTIDSYESQPGGAFRFDTFYEQIALAYGLGIRLDFSYFLLRFDLGMKAYNPASGKDHWAIASQNFKRDAAFHFTVGYPF